MLKVLNCQAEYPLKTDTCICLLHCLISKFCYRKFIPTGICDEGAGLVAVSSKDCYGHSKQRLQ